jgi:hypothetical protein
LVGELPSVVVDQVVVSMAHERKIFQIGRAVVFVPPGDVVRLAPARWSITPGYDTPAVTHDQGPVLGSGRSPLETTDVQDLTVRPVQDG